MSELEDGRRHRRYRVRVPIFITLAVDTYRRLVPVECRDISAGGVAFETTRKLPLEAESRLVLSRLADLPDAAAITGKVVHRKKNPVTHRYEIGVEFTEFVHVTKEQLIAAINAYQPPMSA